MTSWRGPAGRYALALVLVLLLAAGLRFFHLDAQSFWNDEGNSARLSERSLALIVAGTASDIHPPLYYLLLRGWRELLGDSEFGLRALSAFAGVLTVALTAALARALWPGRRGAALLAALLAAVHPALIYYSQETRMYALLALWAVAATWLLLRGAAASGGWRHWALAYGLTAAAGLYTHYFFPIVLLGHNLLALTWLWRGAAAAARRRWFWRWTALMAGTGLLYVPWLPIFWRQAAGREQATAPLPDFLNGIAGFLLQGETGAAGWPAALLLLGGGLWLWLLWRRPAARPAGFILLLSLLLPPAFMIAAGTTRPAVYKFAVVAVPILCLLAGWGVAAAGGSVDPGGLSPAVRVRQEEDPRDLSPRTRAPLLAALLFYVPLLVLAVVALDNLYFNPAYTRADYRGLAAQIRADDRHDVGVILNAANQWEVFTYYFDDVDRVYPLPRGYPDPAQIDAELTAIAAAHDRLYALFWGEAERDPERLVERWLDEHAFKASEAWVGDVRLVIYALPAAPAAAMTTALDYPVGADIILEGYALPLTALPAGDVLPLTLFWHADRPVDGRYKVFLHLVDDAGRLAAQRDSEPGGGLAPTNTWVPAATLRDNHGILVPLDTPPGRYTLLLGLYDVADPAARLLIETPAGDVDALALGQIEIVP